MISDTGGLLQVEHFSFIYQGHKLCVIIFKSAAIDNGADHIGA